jgi:hypothetical protein
MNPKMAQTSEVPQVEEVVVTFNGMEYVMTLASSDDIPNIITSVMLEAPSKAKA